MRTMLYNLSGYLMPQHHRKGIGLVSVYDMKIGVTDSTSCKNERTEK